MMRRLLVIGSRGMLGRDLMEALRCSFPADEILGWDIDEIDIREESVTVGQIEGARPEIVINLAAYTDVDGCEKNELKAFAVNGEGMRHVVLGAMRCGAKVIYLSTDYIFDGKKEKPYLEDDLPNPLNVYGRSKLRGERYLRDLTENGLIIRTQWLYGKHGKNFVSSILHQAEEKEVLSIVDDQMGSPTYTVDLARAIAALIQGGARGIFHVANSDPCSWYTFGQTILRLSGIEGVKVIPISSRESKRPAARPSYSVLSTQKLKKEAGMTLRPWPEALGEYLRLRRAE